MQISMFISIVKAVQIPRANWSRDVENFSFHSIHYYLKYVIDIIPKKEAEIDNNRQMDMGIMNICAFLDMFLEICFVYRHFGNQLVVIG